MSIIYNRGRREKPQNLKKVVKVMMVYVAVINYKVEGYEEHTHTIVVGTFRMKDSAEKALSREYEFIESNINYTVTEMMISEQWIE